MSRRFNEEILNEILIRYKPQAPAEVLITMQDVLVGAGLDPQDYKDVFRPSSPFPSYSSLCMYTDPVSAAYDILRNGVIADRARRNTEWNDFVRRTRVEMLAVSDKEMGEFFARLEARLSSNSK